MSEVARAMSASKSSFWYYVVSKLQANSVFSSSVMGFRVKNLQRVTRAHSPAQTLHLLVIDLQLDVRIAFNMLNILLAIL